MIDVLIDLTPLDTGSRYRGIGRYISCLTEALCALGESELQGLTVSGLTKLCGRTTNCCDPSLEYQGAPKLRKGRFVERIYLAQRRLSMDPLAARLGTQLLHITEARGTPLLGRVPRIVTCHDLIPLVLHQEYLPHKSLKRYLAIERRRYNSAARVIAISQSTASDLVELLDVEPQNIDVIYHGIDLKRFNHIPEEGERGRLRNELGLDRPYILYTGAGDRRKNLDRLIKAFANSGCAREIDLVFAGDLTRRQRIDIIASIERHKIAPHFKHLGFVDDDLVPALYRQCLLYAFPSRYEGFGFPVLEAMACGAPTITTRVSALAEVVGDAGWIVSPVDIEELTEAIRHIVASDSVRKSLRHRGLNRATRFTWRRCALETIASYRRALE